MIYIDDYASPLGQMLLAEEDGALIGVWFFNQKYFKNHCSGEVCSRKTPVLDRAERWLDAYFSGLAPEISDLPLAPKGSTFQKTVWQHLCRIPYGKTTTYGAIAKAVAAEMGRVSMSAQAIGGAVGHNPISVIIPCHRVVGADGSMTGYAGGVKRKIWLLDHEAKYCNNSKC